MGKIIEQPPVKLICGFMWNAAVDIRPAIQIIQQNWGRFDAKTPEFDFSHTQYYLDEFGDHLKKQYVSFERMVSIDDIPDIKILSNEIEERFIHNGSRSVNIDPGYVADAKILMATTKNLAHRTYIGKNIFADLQLIFRRQTYEPTPWTFADMREPRMIEFFNGVREKYIEQLQSEVQHRGQF